MKRQRGADPISVDGGDGFIAGEDVAVALITAHTDATPDGHARALLDPAVVAAARAGEVVLVGRVSGTIARAEPEVIGPQGRPGGSGQMGDELTNLILIAAGGLLGVAFILRLAGNVAAFLTGTPQPTAGAAGGVAVFFNPADPGGQLGADGLNPFVYWVVAALMLGALVTAGFWAWGLLRRTMRQTALDPHRQEGTATRHEIAQTASTKALMRRASTLRPTLENPTPRDVGYRLGTAHRHEVWASWRTRSSSSAPPGAARACSS